MRNYLILKSTFKSASFQYCTLNPESKQQVSSHLLYILIDLNNLYLLNFFPFDNIHEVLNVTGTSLLFEHLSFGYAFRSTFLDIKSHRHSLSSKSRELFASSLFIFRLSSIHETERHCDLSFAAITPLYPTTHLSSQ